MSYLFEPRDPLFQIKMSALQIQFITVFKIQSTVLGDIITNQPNHTQPVWTLFLFKSIWIRPQGSQGCQKMRQDLLNMPFEVWCANIAPERHKLRKIVKIGKKCQKTPVFIDFFKYSSIWGQY